MKSSRRWWRGNWPCAGRMPLRDVFNVLRYVARTGCKWRDVPNDLPWWNVVCQQA